MAGCGGKDAPYQCAPRSPPAWLPPHIWKPRRLDPHLQPPVRSTSASAVLCLLLEAEDASQGCRFLLRALRKGGGAAERPLERRACGQMNEAAREAAGDEARIVRSSGVALLSPPWELAPAGF